MPGRKYDAILSTTDEVPLGESKLMISFGASPKSGDSSLGITTTQHRKRGQVKYNGATMPVYGECAVLETEDESTVLLSGAQGMVGIRRSLAGGAAVIRLGYDLFEEVRLLLTEGQPLEYAAVPTLDLHIEMLRSWILSEGIALLEIPAVPADCRFMVCLTHDIDFVGIRNHKFDHTMWGFLYRSTVGGLKNFLRGRLPFPKLIKMFQAAACLPFVYLGWMKDFWEPFEWYLEVEKGLPTTYFLIPFKGRAGEHVPGKNASRRAAGYDVRELSDLAATLKQRGNEIGVHGIDAWHSAERGCAELKRIEDVAGKPADGIRIHWLLQDGKTHKVLEEAGFSYDASAGYNESVGYRNGTTQVFRPVGARKLLELPTHIQDGALFYPNRLDLDEADACTRCNEIIDNNKSLGGTLTLIWHDRSHGPERFWGDFYINLVETLKDSGALFVTAAGAVEWFRKRREVRFERAGSGDVLRTGLRYKGEEIQPAVRIRMYSGSRGVEKIEHSNESQAEFVDIHWNGLSLNEAEAQRVSQFPHSTPNLTAAPQI
ncbi:MAG TPA: hypothetical protein VFI38_05015 [Candidatus Acidoferrum sp.]|nr:hypothetical protein [Candidatus Acidoferrum sp.]